MTLLDLYHPLDSMNRQEERSVLSGVIDRQELMEVNSLLQRMTNDQHSTLGYESTTIGYIMSAPQIEPAVEESIKRFHEGSVDPTRVQPAVTTAVGQKERAKIMKVAFK